MIRKELQALVEPRTTQKERRQEQRESPPLPNVWDFLQRKVVLNAPDVILRPLKDSSRWMKVTYELSKEEAQLRGNGSDYDKAILDLYTFVTASERYLTLKKFHQFRSDFAEQSVEKIAEVKRQLQELHQLQEDA